MVTDPVLLKFLLLILMMLMLVSINTDSQTVHENQNDQIITRTETVFWVSMGFIIFSIILGFLRNAFGGFFRATCFGRTVFIKTVLGFINTGSRDTNPM